MGFKSLIHVRSYVIVGIGSIKICIVLGLVMLNF